MMASGAGDPISAEATLFVSTARAFLDKHASLAHVRSLHADDLSFDRAWWQRAAELGWTSLLVPDELGGGSVTGYPLRDVASIAEEIGRTVAPGPLNPVSAVLAALVAADNHADHAETIAELVSGRAVGSWAVDEPNRAFVPHEPLLTATATATGYRLDGVKDRVEAGPQADLLLVTARTDDGPRQFIVSASAPGITVSRQRCIDLVKQYARVEFDGVEVDRTAAVGSLAQTATLIERQSQIAMVLQCAETVGILDAVLTMTIAWARDRHSFGRPLASYQALKHRFADMTMWLHACRAITAAAVDEVDAKSPEAQLWVSAAKSYLGEHAGPLVQDCVQLHGGIGVTWEHDLHLYLRRVTLYRNMFGTPSEHHQAIYGYAGRERVPAW
jgi:alkylation response protein AidB-like acyl-CoA dehydrogenase